MDSLLQERLSDQYQLHFSHDFSSNFLVVFWDLKAQEYKGATNVGLCMNPVLKIGLQVRMVSITSS